MPWLVCASLLSTGPCPDAFVDRESLKTCHAGENRAADKVRRPAFCGVSCHFRQVRENKGAARWRVPAGPESFERTL